MSGDLAVYTVDSNGKLGALFGAPAPTNTGTMVEQQVPPAEHCSRAASVFIARRDDRITGDAQRADRAVRAEVDGLGAVGQ